MDIETADQAKISCINNVFDGARTISIMIPQWLPQWKNLNMTNNVMTANKICGFHHFIAHWKKCHMKNWYLIK